MTCSAEYNIHDVQYEGVRAPLPFIDHILYREYNNIDFPKMSKMLDLRYNEMWNDWQGTDDDLRPDLTNKQYAHESLVLSWKSLNVSVKTVTQKYFSSSTVEYKQILCNVSGNAQCGRLLGIMGSSGSGKTTLISTISHRTKGNFDGELLLNGQPVSEEVMIKISGFVPQHDVSIEQLTALEHLSLMAKLKMDRNPTEIALNENVDHIVSTLAMDKFAHTRISFLSGGERKKVALAVQLLNDPPILFCDEITTGLDSYSAAHIVNTLKNVARTGKIVVCTIHQPASGVFGKFDDVILLTEGRLAYQGPVTMVNQLFQKFNYVCPNMFNEADYVISILNSDKETVKRDVDEMCRLSLTECQTNLNCDTFNNQKQMDFMHYLHIQKPIWTTQFTLIFGRSTKCFFRSFQSKLLELGILTLLSVVISSSYANIKFDTEAVQNWEGFWLITVNELIFHNSYLAVAFYEERFTVVHREVYNKTYPLSVYFVSELLIATFWLIIKLLFYCITAFTIVGVEWGLTELCVYFVIAVAGFSHGSLTSVFFDQLENTIIFASIDDFVALPLSGAYVSLKSLPKFLYYLRYCSVFFLGCEMVSILFWEHKKSIPCFDPDNCVASGTAVLDKFGYIAGEYNLDLTILVSFIIIANLLSFRGILNKMKKKPAY